MPYFSQENHISTLLDALNPVRDAVKNWGIDVAQYLETYLEQIASENGANFREAALLIQNSTVIYVKKVDYLWIITQELVNNIRRQRLEEDKQKTVSREKDGEAVAQQAADPETDTTRKKRKHKDDKTKYIEINIEVSEKLLELEPTKENRQPWKFLPDVYHQFQKRPLSSKRRVVYGMGGEEQEVRHYKCNSVLLPSMTLHHEFKNETTVPFTCGFLPEVEEATMEIAAGMANEPRLMDMISDHESLTDNHPPSPVASDCEDAGGPPPTIDPEPEDRPPTPDLLPEEPIPIVENKVAVKAEKKKRIYSEEKQQLKLFEKKPWLLQRASIYVLETDESKFENFRGFDDLVTETLSDGEIEGFRGFPPEIKPKKVKRISKRVRELQAAELAEQLSRTSPLLSEDQMRAAVLAEDNDSYAALEMMADDAEPCPESDVPDSVANEAVQAESQLDLAKRVNAWHQSIRGKLAQAEERGHFDIHEYGSKILDTFPQTSAKTTMSFQELLENVDTCDVPRYFLSALQLANTSNIELETGDQLCMDQMELTLLSHARHHEDLQDYVAPSREDGTEGPISTSFHLARNRKRK